MTAPEILTAKDGKLVLSLDKGLYPLEVIYGAAYIFIDRAYVLLGKVDDTITVEIAVKDDADEAGLRALAGEFGNELLSQALRRRITKENQNILETIVSQALAGATGAMVPSAFEDDEDDDDLDFLDDPLGIAVPWEERFKKRGSAPAQPGPDTERDAGPGDSGGFKPTGEK
ncbi:MAG: His-Xaa-Ser system protein HxsD [Deltaproteobacteria bacterium]|nr:His-Xaa-Ser system protein HxsD [Deltaproteobacteria bacterium]MCB9788793.1 His-Xaa-Ser system protein HxsD [Deltaproteobacteria bacterium]